MKKKITKTKKKNNTYFVTYENTEGILSSTTIKAPNFNEMIKIFEKDHNFTHDEEILSARRVME